jgi:putative SOS response-associated peptidase YedK
VSDVSHRARRTHGREGPQWRRASQKQRAICAQSRGKERTKTTKHESFSVKQRSQQVWQTGRKSGEKTEADPISA